MSRWDGLLFDLDGVFYVGDQAIEGAAEALAWVQAQAIPHLFVTNTTSRSRSALVRKLQSLDLAVSEAQVLTPAIAAVEWLRRNQRQRVALFVPAATRGEFDEFETAEPGCEDAAVVVGDLGEAWDFATLNRAFRLLHGARAELLALGMTRFWRAPDGLRLDTGPFVRALEYASGRQAVVTGKPAAAFFHAAAQRLDIDPGRLLMIGDDIRGDVEAAQQAGLGAVQVRSGKFTAADLELGIRPDAVLESVAALPRWWSSR